MLKRFTIRLRGVLMRFAKRVISAHNDPTEAINSKLDLIHLFLKFQISRCLASMRVLISMSTASHRLLFAIFSFFFALRINPTNVRVTIAPIA